MNSLVVLVVCFVLVETNGNLVKNGNFKDGLNSWDKLHSKPIPKENHVQFPLKKKIENILIQSIYKNEQNEPLQKNNNPLVIKFSHQILAETSVDFDIFQYVNIRLVNGSYLPIWNVAPKKTHKTWETDCVLVPYQLRIQNILVVVGEDNRKENSGMVLVKDVEIFQLKTDSVMELQDKFSKSCNRITTSMRSVDNYKVEANKYKSISKIENLYDVTLCAAISVDRLEYLKMNERAFHGPISVAIYIHDLKDILVIDEFWKKNENFKNHVSFHFVYAQNDHIENPRKLKELSESFPINFLRNIAIKYSKTELFLYVDVDFIVSENLFEDTRTKEFSKIMRSRERNVLILPAYYGKYAKNRNILIDQIQKKKSQKCGFASHKITNFERWESNSIFSGDDEFFPSLLPTRVGASHHPFEPYYIAPKSIPLYSERYIGCGQDKIQQCENTYLSNYQFFVWRKHFIVHADLGIKTKSLCLHFPPLRYFYHAMLAHSWMARDELKNGWMDVSNDRFETVSGIDKEARRKFILKEFRVYKENVKSYIRVETAYIAVFIATMTVLIYLMFLYFKRKRTSIQV
eukprot:gene10426-2953_t